MSDRAGGWTGPLVRLARWRDMPFPDGRLLRERLVDAACGLGVIIGNAWRWFRGCCGEAQAGMIFVALLGLLATVPKPAPPEMALVLRVEEPVPAVEPPPYALEPWQAVAPKFAALALEAPELAGPPIQRLRMLPAGLRQDLMVWPADRAGAVTGAITVERLSDRRIADDESLFVGLARRMALTGASIERIAAPTLARSKFGPVEVSDMQAIIDRRAKSCLGFRTLADAPVTIAGWFCGSDKPLDRAGLTCIVDRLDLIGAGADTELRTWFALADQQRASCTGRGTLQARHTDAGAVQLKQALPETAMRARGTR